MRRCRLQCSIRPTRAGCKCAVSVVFARAGATGVGELCCAVSWRNRPPSARPLRYAFSRKASLFGYVTYGIETEVDAENGHPDTACIELSQCSVRTHCLVLVKGGTVP
jgi:hypothetical protein